MKTCQNCGHENGDNTKFCSKCGYNLQNMTPTDSQTNINQNEGTYQQPNDIQDFQQSNNTPTSQQVNQQIDSQQQYNNQQNTYNYQSRPQKNALIAILLDVIGGLIFYFLSGIGQIYLGLYTRGIVLCVMGIVVTVINILIMLIFSEWISGILSFVLGIALVAYSAYDAYLCTNAINEGRTIPLLFGALDLQ